MKKVAIYIRCSSEEAKKIGFSPKIQEEQCKEFVKKMGWKLDKKHIYADIGDSGYTDKRENFQRLLADARNKKFDVIVVYRLDRLFRNLRLLENTLNELVDLGIGVKSITEPWADYSNPSARLNIQVLGAVAEWQRNITLEAQINGQIRFLKEGKYIGGKPPLGYRINKETKKLEIDEEEASLVRKMFSWIVDEKISEYKVQKRLNEMGIPTKFDRLGRKKKSGSKNWWQSTTIKRILRNPIYIGELYYRKYKDSRRARNKNNLRPREEWIRVEVPAIISKETFERAQLQLKKNQEFSIRKTKRTYAFQHKIVCGLDQKRWQCSTNSKGVKYYYCPATQPNHTPNRCTAPCVSERRILPPVWENLKELLSRPQIVLENLREYYEQKYRKSSLQKELEELNKRLEKIEREKERYSELYAKESIDEKFLDRKLVECEERKLELLKERERLEQLLLREEEKRARIYSLQELYQELREKLENATYEIKVEIIKKLVNKVVIFCDNLEIEYNLPLIEPKVQNYAQPSFCSHNQRV